MLRSFPSILVALVMLGGLAARAAPAEPDFSTSTATFLPAMPVAGDVVRYSFAITNSGADSSHTEISIDLSRGHFIGAEADCAQARYDIERRVLSWQGGAFNRGATRHCTLRLLTRRDAYGTIATVSAEIRTMPRGYFNLEARPELGSTPAKVVARIGPLGMTGAGAAVLSLLAVFLAGIPVIAIRMRKGEGARRHAVVGSVGGAIGVWFVAVVLTRMRRVSASFSRSSRLSFVTGAPSPDDEYWFYPASAGAAPPSPWPVALWQWAQFSV